MAQEQLHDTPPRQHPPVEAKASTIRKDMMKDIPRISVYDPDKKAFLDTFLPLPVTISQQLLERFEEEGLYNRAKWNELPSLESEPNSAESSDQKAKSKEADIYSPLVSIINKIASYAEEMVPPGKDRLSGRWVGSYDQPLKTLHPFHDGRELKPDITFTSDKVVETTSQALSVPPVIQPELRRSGRSRTTSNHSSEAGDIAMEGSSDEQLSSPVSSESYQPSEQAPEVDNNAPQVWWTQAYTVMEVKLKESRTRLLRQLGTYAQRILAEQIDRLYVIALTLCTNFLHVYLFDRSGIIGTQEAIDIHKDPELFIQVIASFSCLPAERLGWDPTCQIWDKVTKAAVCSYKLPPTAFHNRSTYDIPWVFDNKYIAIDPVGLVRSRRIWGRGTNVFRVVKLDDWMQKNTQAKVYILKQQWQRLPGLAGSDISLENSDSTGPAQPEGQDKLAKKHGLDSKPYEAFIIDKADLRARMETAYFVKMEGRVVDTFKAIRKDRTKSLPPPNTGKPPTDKASNISTKRSKGSGSYIRSTTAGDRALLKALHTSSATKDQNDHPGLVSRTLCRIVSKPPGWPLDQFATRLELLESLRGVVCELEKLYKKGIVHRDVGLGNMIISEDGGHIIDFDHSKFTEASKDIKRKEKVVWSKIDQTVLGVSVDEDAMELATRIAGKKAVKYVAAVREMWYPDGSEAKATIEDLGWPKENYPLPDFEERAPGPGFITGTLAFASCHIGDDGHNAIHDLDSLWWTVAYIPLHYTGPGDEREDPPNDIINKYYSGPDAKRSLYRPYGNDGHVRLDKIFANFSPYFSGLVPLMRQWFTFLTVAFHYFGYEYYYPHRILLKILDEAIEREKKNGPETDKDHLKATMEEYKRRDEEKRDTEKAISEHLTVHFLREERKANVPHRGAQLSDPAAQQDPSTQTLNPEPGTAEATTLGSRSREELWSPNTSPSKERPQKRTKSDPQ